MKAAFCSTIPTPPGASPRLRTALLAACLASAGVATAQPLLVNEVYFSGGNLETGDEFIELIVQRDMTAEELNSYYVGDTATLKTAKASAYRFTNMQRIAPIFPRGTIIVLGGSGAVATEDLLLDPVAGDWVIQIRTTNATHMTGNGTVGNVETNDIIWVDTDALAVSLTIGGRAVDLGTGTGAFLSAIPAWQLTNLGAPTNNTATRLSTERATVTTAGNWVLNGTATIGAGNVAANTTAITTLQTALQASDSAGSAAYAPTWDAGDNGGTGFGAWTVTTASADTGFGIASSTTNGDGNSDTVADIDTSAGAAFYLEANSSFVSEAIRPITSALGDEDQISVSFDNGTIAAGGSAGFQFRDASNNVLFELVATDSSTHYSFTDGASLVPADGTSGRPTLTVTDEGIHLTLRLKSSSTYQLRVANAQGVGSTYSGALNGSTAIANVRFHSTGAGLATANRVYFNDLRIIDNTPFVESVTRVTPADQRPIAGDASEIITYRVTFSEGLTVGTVANTDFTATRLSGFVATAPTVGTPSHPGTGLVNVPLTVSNNDGAFRLDALPFGNMNVTDLSGFAAQDAYNTGIIYYVSGPPDLNTAFDTGTSTTDNLTRLQTIQLDVTAQAGASVRLLRGGVEVATAIADAANKVNFTDTMPAVDGPYAYTVEVTNDSVTVLNTAARTVTLDTTAPTTVSSVEPDMTAATDSGDATVWTNASTDNYTSDTTPDFLVTGPASTLVALVVDGVIRQTGTTSAGGTITFTTAPALIGNPATSYLVQSAVTDTAGNLAPLSPGITVTTDTVAPTAPTGLTIRTQDDSGTSQSDRITNVNNPIFTGSCQSDVAIELRNNTTRLATVIPGATSFQIQNAVAFADAAYTQINARAIDQANNIAASGNITMTIDTVAPGAPTATPDLVTASDTGVSSTDNITGDNTASFSVPFTGAAANWKVELLDTLTTNTVVGTLTTTNGTSPFTATTNALPDGIYNIAARMLDIAGNAGPATASGLTVEIIASPPVISSAARLTPASASPTTDSQVTWRVTFSQKMNATTVGTADFIAETASGDPGTHSIVSATQFSATEWDVVATSGGVGERQVRLALAPARVIQNLANVNMVATTNPSEEFAIDFKYPRVDFLPITTPRTSAVGVVTIQWTEPVSGFDLSDLALTRGLSGVDISGLSLVAVDGDTYTIDLSTVTAGNAAYGLSVKTVGSAISDGVGNPFTAGGIVAWTNDIIPPTISLTTPSDTTLVATSTAFPFTVSDDITDLGTSGIASTILEIQPVGGAFADSGTVPIAGSFPYNWASEGAFAVRGTATDGAGNTSSTTPVTLHVAAAANGTTQTLVASSQTLVLPMTSDLDVTIAISGATPGGTIQVLRNPALSSGPADIDFNLLVTEALTINGQGLGTGWTAAITWQFDAANATGVTPATALRYSGSTQEQRITGLTPVGNSVQIPNVTQFGTFYIGDAPVSVQDWSVLQD
ncbi:hypothetical protein GC173_14600 [bacterium]|nr:hypothetical protein [bacterium]